jgi:FkbM family methyltransferase
MLGVAVTMVYVAVQCFDFNTSGRTNPERGGPPLALMGQQRRSRAKPPLRADSRVQLTGCVSTPLAPSSGMIQLYRRFRRSLRRLRAAFENRALVRLLNRFALSHGRLTVVQIGAHDGLTSDHMRPLILKHGWTGVLVEPVPEHFQRLQANYANVPGLRFERAAIAGHNGQVTFHKVRTDLPGLPRHAHLVHSLKYDVVLNEIGGRADALTAIHVPALMFQTLLDKHRLDHVDVLAIDTEGADYEILRQVDFSRHRPLLVLYEHKHLSLADREACQAMLAGHGYSLQTYTQDTVATRS